MRLNSYRLDKTATILADDILIAFLDENDRIPIHVSQKCLPRSQINK